MFKSLFLFLNISVVYEFTLFIFLIILSLTILSQASDAEIQMNENPYYFSNTILLGEGGNWTSDIEFVDFDRDGDPDAIVANYLLPNELYRNDGKGQYTKIGEFGAGGGSYENGKTNAIAVGDVNGDRFIDIVEANRFGEKSNIWLGDGNGHFTQSGVLTDETFNTTDVELSDLDGDGDLDAVTANESFTNWNTVPALECHSKVCIHRNDNGVFQVIQTINEGFEPRDIALGDMDHDGDLDIVAGNEGDSDTRSSGEDKVYLNDGKGNFTLSATFGSPNDNTFSVALGDVDQDGDLDIALGDFGVWDGMGGSPAQNYIYLNDGDGKSFTPKAIASCFGFTSHLVMGDVDRDGDLDLAAGNFSTDRPFDNPDPMKTDVMNGVDFIFLNDGKGNYPQHIRLGEGDFSEYIGLADVNGDGCLDIITGNGDPDTVNDTVPVFGQNVIYINDLVKSGCYFENYF